MIIKKKFKKINVLKKIYYLKILKVIFKNIR